MSFRNSKSITICCILLPLPLETFESRSIAIRTIEVLNYLEPYKQDEQSSPIANGLFVCLFVWNHKGIVGTMVIMVFTTQRNDRKRGSCLESVGLERSLNTVLLHDTALPSQGSRDGRQQKTKRRGIFW